MKKGKLSLAGSTSREKPKASGKKPLVLTKPMENGVTGLESILKLVKKLSNEVLNF